MSDQCPYSFGWCDEQNKEFVNFDELGMNLTITAENFECLAATFYPMNNDSDLILIGDDCRKHKIALCEEVGFIII
jgi:hypothetical protein